MGFYFPAIYNLYEDILNLRQYYTNKYCEQRYCPSEQCSAHGGDGE